MIERAAGSERRAEKTGSFSPARYPLHAARWRRE
jgi:hypothetical protein